jgi:hypothetical protein
LISRVHASADTQTTPQLTTLLAAAAAAASSSSPLGPHLLAVLLLLLLLLCVSLLLLLLCVSLLLLLSCQQLTFRTLTRDFDEPHANKDHLAAKFRDELMPRRGQLHRQRSPMIQISRVR